MKELSVSQLHCEDCSQALVTHLERLTGKTGYAYDEEEQTLTIPEGVDLDLVCDVLSADKIAIRHGSEPDCVCVECRYPLRGQGDHAVADTYGDAPVMDRAHTEEGEHEHAHTHTHATKTEHNHAHAGEAEHEHAHEHAQARADANPVPNRGHAHEHAHGHHSHSHAQGGSVRNITIVFLMNLLFSIAEFIFGAVLNSTAIFADAVHDLGDAISVGLVLTLEKRSKRHADGSYSFGHRRFSLLGALVTGSILLLGSVFSLSRAVPRLLSPELVNYDGMLVMALVAIALNAVSAWALSRGKSRNEGMLNLHMLEDVVGWVGILIMSIVLRYTDWYILDPLFSIALSVFIIYKAAPNVWDTLKILMESVPENVRLEQIEQQLLALPHVHGFTHLHMWSMDGQSNNFAVSLFTDLHHAADQKLLRERVHTLLAPYSVECSTVEIDYDPEKRFIGKLG